MEVMRRTRPGRALASVSAAVVAALVLGGAAADAGSLQWKLVSSPNISSTQGDGLIGMSCVSTSFCMSAGYYYNGTVDQTFISKRNGNSWSQVSSYDTSSSQNNSLNGVSCVSSSFCMAVGDYFNGTNYQTLIEKWSGGSWKVVGSPSTSSTQDNFLYGVSCKSTSFCMAGGEYSNGTNYQTLIEKWSGSAWSQVGSPNSSSTQDNFLSAMSCVGTNFCMVAGAYKNGTNLQTLIERWSGSSWSLVSSPNTSSTQLNALNGVSCLSKSFCMAAGNYSNGSNDQTLIEKWNGSTWKVVMSPNSSPTLNNDLGGVSCVSTGFCMATGRGRNATNDQTLIEKWNGSSWQAVSSPNTSSTQDNDLFGVNCVSTAFCMASGYYFNGTNEQTLIEKW